MVEGAASENICEPGERGRTSKVRRQAMMPKAGRIQAMALVLSVACLGLPLSPLSAQEPKLRATLTGHAEAVWSVAFSPDGKTLASGGGFAGTPGDIRLWDVATGKERATLQGHTNGVN